MFVYNPAGHSAVWDRSDGGGCAADPGLPRLKEDMPDADEADLATNVQVSSACYKHVPDDRVSEVHFADAGTLGSVGACLGFAAHSSCECPERPVTL